VVEPAVSLDESAAEALRVAVPVVLSGEPVAEALRVAEPVVLPDEPVAEALRVAEPVVLPDESAAETLRVAEPAVLSDEPVTEALRVAEPEALLDEPVATLGAPVAAAGSFRSPDQPDSLRLSARPESAALPSFRLARRGFAHPAAGRQPRSAGGRRSPWQTRSYRPWPPVYAVPGTLSEPCAGRDWQPAPRALAGVVCRLAHRYRQRAGR